MKEAKQTSAETLKERSTIDVEALPLSLTPLTLILTWVAAAQKFSFQSSQVCDSNKGVDAKTQGDRNQKRGWGRPKGKPCSPSGSGSSDQPGDLLEQRATGGKQPSK